MRRCPECGKEFEGTGSFCPNCGKYMPYTENIPQPQEECTGVQTEDDIPVIPPYTPEQNNSIPSGFEQAGNNNAKFDSCVTPSSWSFVLSLFISSIPVVGFIYVLCLALGATKYKAKRNLARALFIWVFICLVIESAIFILISYFYPDVIRQINLQYIDEIKNFIAFWK